MPSRLSIYNGALRICGERRLASLTENVKARHELDAVWNDGEGVKQCLEAAPWKFAKRSDRLDPDPDFTRQFGYQYGYRKPDDFALTISVAQDEYFRGGFDQYEDEAGWWYADIQPIYVQYVSTDTGYGMDLSLWPARFTEYVETFFASKVVFTLTGDKAKHEGIAKPRGGLLAVKLSEAKSQDAFGGPAKFPAQGSWISARRGRSGGDRYGGGSLTS